MLGATKFKKGEEEYLGGKKQDHNDGDCANEITYYTYTGWHCRGLELPFKVDDCAYDVLSQMISSGLAAEQDQFWGVTLQLKC